MELHQVRYFLALARSLNFTRAAEQCNVTQPALTKAVQKLEYELGGSLIHRERQLTQLTDLGKLVLPMVERTLAAAEAVRLSAREFHRKDIAPLRIALAPYISATLLIQPLAEITRVIPGLQVELVETSEEQLAELLLGGEVSAALSGESHEWPDRLDHWRLFDERFVILASANNPLSRLHPIPMRALEDAVWLQRIGCRMQRRLWKNYCPEAWEPKISHSGHHEAHLQHLAAGGFGIMLAPEHAPHLPSLVQRPICGDPLRQEIHLLVVAGRRYSPALDAFVKTARLRDWNADIRSGLSERLDNSEAVDPENRNSPLETYPLAKANGPH